MRFIIHYVGDMHQPLHSTTRVDHKYPKGDFGGNLVYLPDREGAHNLHAVWDSVGYEFTGYAELPFSDKEWQNITQTALDLIEKYDITEKEATNVDVYDWAKDTFEISKTTVYPSIVKNKMPTDEYIEKARSVAERQVVLGGYRLANLLQSMNLKAHQKPKTYFAMVNDEFTRMVDYFMSFTE